MSELKYPNESPEYRRARDALLEKEYALITQVKAVAAQRRELPLGGKLKEDYLFIGANDDNFGKEVPISALFGDQRTLIMYSYMFGPGWDNPCMSCTSLVDGFDRAAISVSRDAAFMVIAAASAKQLNDVAKNRGWRNIRLLSAGNSGYLRDYQCQSGEDETTLVPAMHVFTKRDDGIYHFWGTEMQGNSIDMVWVYWNLMDMTPEGRPDRMTPPQNFRSRFLEKHYLHKED